MFSDERKTAMLNILAKHQRLIVIDVAQDLNVSESTIRRDLQELEQQGLLKRTHGGAVALEIAAFEPTVQEKAQLNVAEKSQIAALALQFIKPDETILLDAGTTTLAIARQLPDMNLTVVTNSLEIISILNNYKNVSVMVLGGELRKNTGALAGAYTDWMLAQLNVDKLFLATNGIDMIRGLTTAHTLEASAKKAMIQAARDVILVADHSKLDQVHRVQFSDLREINTFISDEPVPAHYQKTFHDQGIQVVTPAAKSSKEDR